MRLYIGIDNGVSGTVGIVGDGVPTVFRKVPVRSEQDYTKAKKMLTRIDAPRFRDLVCDAIANARLLDSDVRALAVIERPMVNPERFAATGSALRAFEAILIVLEEARIARQFVDSRQWQKVMLPLGTKGAPDLKGASADAGSRLFPEFEVLMRKHGDADGLLMAEWARRSAL